MDVCLEVGWYGEHVGTICKGEESITWAPTDSAAARVFQPEQLPHLLKHLKPEGWLAARLGFEGDVYGYASEGLRFLSNIRIAPDVESLVELGLDVDVHDVHVRDFVDESGVFTGRYAGASGRYMTEELQREIGALWESRLAPRFSGTQFKLPVTLYADDEGPMIKPAESTPFTHILKLPLTGLKQSLPTIEWLGLELAQSAGLRTSEHALVDMPAGMAPALLIERFDIPDHNIAPHKQLLIQDFCNLMQRDPENCKYDSPLEDCADALLASASNPEPEKREFFKRVVFAWVLRDFDMHMKNISVLKTYDTITGNLETKLAPTYDALTTAIYEDINNDENFALSLGGKTQSLTVYDFKEFARHLDIPEAEALEMIEHISEHTAQRATEILNDPPEPVKRNHAASFALKCAVTQIVLEVEALGFKTPETFQDYTFASEFIPEARESAAIPRPKFPSGPA